MIKLKISKFLKPKITFPQLKKLRKMKKIPHKNSRNKSQIHAHKISPSPTQIKRWLLKYSLKKQSSNFKKILTMIMKARIIANSRISIQSSYAVHHLYTREARSCSTSTHRHCCALLKGQPSNCNCHLTSLSVRVSTRCAR